ncbi:MAG: ComEC/Rec2 family competence protein [Alistipes sp.]|nr:ComEC/Rec2 family competence protein [Alistipes sp.]
MSPSTSLRCPMVIAAILFMAGIALFDAVEVPAWALWGGFILSLLGAAIWLRSQISNIYIAVALILFGGVVVSLRSFRPQIPTANRIYLTLEVDDNPVIRKGFAVMPAHITEWDNKGEILPADERINLYLDTLVKANFGTRIEALGRIVPFPEKFGSYGELMTRRGFSGTIFLRADDILAMTHTEKRTLHSVTAERLERLGLAGDAAAIVGAMAVGNRKGMTPELRQAYSRAGASHILAVSGLHVGIVFMLCNILLAWLPLVRHGQIIRAVAVVVPIWIYAAMCGFSPSVVRAAVMFTALQAAVATSSRYVSLNILAATAFAMLVYSPDYLFDLSFQLSFIAVAAIVEWGVPLMRSLRSGRRWLDALTATMVVGAVSAIATMPLVAHTFGVVSIVGVLLNPIVILCAYAIVIVAILWIVMPIGWLAGVFGAGLSWVGAGLNFVVEGIALRPWSAVEIGLSTRAVWLIYGVAIAITAVAHLFETKKSVNLPL